MRKIIATLLIVSTALLSGCGEESSFSQSSSSSLPMNTGHGAQSVFESVVSGPDYPEAAPTDVLRTPIEEGGYIKIDGDEYVLPLVPEYGLAYPDDMDLGTFSLEYYFFNIENEDLLPTLFDSLYEASGRVVNAYSSVDTEHPLIIGEDEDLPQNFKFGFYGHGIVLDTFSDTPSPSVYIEVVDENGEVVTGWHSMFEFHDNEDAVLDAKEWYMNYAYKGYSVKAIAMNLNEDGYNPFAMFADTGVMLDASYPEVVNGLYKYEFESGGYLYDCYKSEVATLLIRFAKDEGYVPWVESVYLFRNAI